MPRDLAQTLGLEWPETAAPPVTRNVSVGMGVEVLLRLNRADVTMGTIDRRFARLLRGLVASAEGDREVPGLAAEYEPPAELWEAIEDEADFLTRRAGDAGVEVVDPHGLLATWSDRTPPKWYQQVSGRELVVPGLPEPFETEELLWRVRQERTALRNRAGRAEADLKASSRTVARQAAELERLRGRLAAMEASRSWRVTKPLRRATEGLRRSS